MSFSTTKPWAQYNGNGSTTIFAFTHRFYDDSDIRVLLTDSAGVSTLQTITTHYTLTGKSTQPGDVVAGEVTMLTAPATGEKLTIYRKPDFTQPDTFSSDINWYGAPIEIRFDIVTMFSQYLKLETDRSIRGPLNDLDSLTFELPSAANRASKFLFFDGSGNVGVSAATVEDHELLNGLLGGAASDHYHLTGAQHAEATRKASTTQSGLLTELATIAEVDAGTDIARAITPDAFAGSVHGTRIVEIPLFQSDTAVATGNGKDGILITAELNGMNLSSSIAGVHDKGITGTTEIQLRRRRAGADVDMLSTKITIGDEFFASDGVIDTDNDDLQTGDMIYVDVDLVHSGTPPNGLTVAIQARLP
jgi:hypothetical protein